MDPENQPELHSATPPAPAGIEPIDDEMIEPKWFIYVGPRPEGPLTILQLQDLVTEELCSEEDFVWARGMADWTPLSQVPVLSRRILGREILQTETVAAPSTIEKAADAPLPARANPFIQLQGSPRAAASGAATAATSRGIDTPKETKPKQGDRVSRAAAVLAVAMTVALAAAVFVTKSRVGSPVSTHVSLVSGNLFTPSFEVIAGVPDGTVLTLELNGLPATLVDRLSYHARDDLRMRKSEARSLPFAAGEGRALSRGRYQVTLKDSAGKVLAGGSYFLGGREDSSYEKALLDFHRLLREEAKAELAEVTQYNETLRGQLAALEEERLTTSVIQDPRSAQRAWRAFDSRWGVMQAQINRGIEQWTSQVIDRSLYYGSLYRDLKKLNALIVQARSAAPDDAASALTEAYATLGRLTTGLSAAQRGFEAGGDLPRREELGKNAQN